MFVEIFRQYTQALREANAFDFDDLIAQTVYLFRAFPQVAALYQRRFRHILVDEYQDTNHAQYALIRELTRPVPAELAEDLEADNALGTSLRGADGGIPGASLTVVGDSDQSIYAFRGADIRNIVEFERDFPNSKVILLEQNYRSTQNILDAANSVISNNFDRKDKKLFTTIGSGDKILGFTGYSGHDEAQFIADEISKLRDAGRRLQRHRGVLPHELADARARGHLHPLGPALQGARRHQVLRAGRDQGCDGVPHHGRQPRRPDWPCAAS